MPGLSVLCAGLGFLEENRDGNVVSYTPGKHCLENLKDLLRFLRRDDPQTRDVFKQVSKWNIVPRNLIPILQYCHDPNMILTAVKVLVLLSMPIEPQSHDVTVQMEFLWELKDAVTRSEIIVVIVSLLEGPLERLENGSFEEDDWKLVQLVLTLFRNILAIQDVSLLQKVGGSTCQFLSLRDRFLERLFYENAMDLFIIITQHINGSCDFFREDNFLLLEIFHHCFLGQDAELIAKTHFKINECTSSSLDSLKYIIDVENKKVTSSRNKISNSHSGGIFTRVTMDGSKAVVKGHPVVYHDSLNPQRIVRGPSKKIVSDYMRLPSTSDNLLGLLHQFLNNFLSGGYNVLMQSCFEDIEQNKETDCNDVIVFFHVAEFVTSFQLHRLNIEFSAVEDTFNEDNNKIHSGGICGSIAETMKESMFVLVISRLRHAFDGLKETNEYKFLSTCGSLLKKMILMLELVLRLLPHDSKESQTSRILLYKLFYDQTDQGMTQFLLTLIKSFNVHRQPKSDLADLVEIIVVIVRLMEILQGRGVLRVSKKSRRRQNKTVSGKHNCRTEVSDGDETAAKRHLTSNIGKFDKQGDESPEPVSHSNCTSSIAESVDEQDSDHIEVLGFSASESSENEHALTTEADFSVSSLVSAFANHSIINNLCWLLKFYKSNASQTNDCIISMLRRITEDLDLSPMLYQLSLLTTFHAILSEQKSYPCKEYNHIADFLTHLVRRMLKKMKNNPLLFVEVLFWKSRKECHFINTESSIHDLGRLKKHVSNLGSDSDSKRVLPKECASWAPRCMSDALGDDEADVELFHRVGSPNGHERIDLEKESTDGIRNPKRRLFLTDNLKKLMKALYEKFKDDENCNHLIASSLCPEYQVSASQVSRSLKKLGIEVKSKKMKHYSNGEISGNGVQHGEQEEVIKTGSDYGSADLEQRSEKNIKNIQPLGADNDDLIRDLFEQFRNHKRCSHVIASALAADNSVTAAQVSRKLRKLGLRGSRDKRSTADMTSEDGETNYPSAEALGSDHETLASYMKGSKRKLASRKRHSESMEGSSYLYSDKDETEDGRWAPENRSHELEDSDVEEGVAAQERVGARRIRMAVDVEEDE